MLTDFQETSEPFGNASALFCPSVWNWCIWTVRLSESCLHEMITLIILSAVLSRAISFVRFLRDSFFVHLVTRNIFIYLIIRIFFLKQKQLEVYSSGCCLLSAVSCFFWSIVEEPFLEIDIQIQDGHILRRNVGEPVANQCFVSHDDSFLICCPSFRFHC